MGGLIAYCFSFGFWNLMLSTCRLEVSGKGAQRFNYFTLREMVLVLQKNNQITILNYFKSRTAPLGGGGFT